MRGSLRVNEWFFERYSMYRFPFSVNGSLRRSAA
jgi:hypothetical protein